MAANLMNSTTVIISDPMRFGYCNHILILLMSADCGEPPDQLHASKTFSAGLVNDTTVFTCNKNYSFAEEQAEKLIVCQENGTWSVLNSSCLGLQNIL